MTSLVEDWESDNFEVPQIVPKIVTANELLEKDINEMLEKKDQILGSFMQKVAFEPPVKAKNSSLREKPLRENRTSKFILTKQFSDSSLSSLVNAVQSTENISPIVCEIIVSQLSLLFMKFGNHVKNLSNYLQIEPLPFGDQIVHFYNLGGIQNHIDSIDTFFIQISHYFQDHSKSDHQFIKYLLEKIIIIDETIVFVERLFTRSVPLQELQNSYPPSFIYLMNECLLLNEFTKHVHLLSAEFLQMQLKLSSLSDVIDQEQELERMEPDEITEATERIHQKRIVFFKRLRQSIFQERIILQNCFAVLFSYLSIYYHHHDEIQLAKQYSIKKEIPLEILQNLLFPVNDEEQQAKESGDRQDEEEREEDLTKGKENRKENHQKKQKKNSVVKCFQLFFELIAIFLQQEFFIAMQIAAENQWEFPPSLFHFMNFDTLLQPLFELEENDYDESRLSSFPLHYQPNDCSKGMLLRKLYLIRNLLFKFAKICSQESLPIIPMLQLDWAPWKCNKYCSLLSFSDSGSITILSYYVKYFFSIEKQQILQQIYEKLYHKNNNLKKIDSSSSSSNKVIIQEEDYRMNPQIKELQLKNSIVFHERMIDISSFFYIEKNNLSYLKLFRAIHTITKEIYQQFQQRISSSLPISIRFSLLNDYTTIIQPMSACFELIQFMIFQFYFIFPKISKSILSFYHFYFFSSSKHSSCYFLTTSQTKQQLQTILKLFEFLPPPPSNNHSRRIIPFILNDLNPYFGYYQKEISSIDYPFSLFSSISFPQWEKLCAERKAKDAELRWRSGSRRKYPSLEEEAELEADLRYGAAGENDGEEELEGEEEQEEDIWVNSERKDFGDEDHQDHSDGNYPQEKESSHYYEDYQQESNTIHQVDESSQLDDF